LLENRDQKAFACYRATDIARLKSTNSTKK
jgi:hypothetical protein